MTITIKQLQESAYAITTSKGFHAFDNTPDGPTFGDRIALVHTELSEAIEAFRGRGAPVGTGAMEPWYSGTGLHPKPEGVPSELADVVIRVADMSQTYGIDLEKAIEEKLAFNKTRTHMHGGKRL